MSARTAPTERQRRLGAEVRKMRTASGMSAEYAARLLGVDRGKISHMESGVRAISPERVRTLACNCACDDEDYVNALVEMASPAKRGWWERYRGTLPPGLLDIAELEAGAHRIRSVHPLHIPGVLQTTDHALAVFRAVLPALPEGEIALRLAHRLARQQLLEAEDAPEYCVVIHEAALRMQFGGRGVARAQLERLAALSERPSTTIRVLTFEAGAFPGAGQTINYLEGPVPQLDTVQIDNAHGPDFLSAEAQLAKYRSHLDWLEHTALPQAESRDLILKIAHDL